MPNEYNLVTLAGKKNNKKKKQQQPAFRARPQFYMAPVGPNRSLVRVEVPTTFQAPHHQQNSMVELSDDTSPKTPLATNTDGLKPNQNATTAATVQSTSTSGVQQTKHEKLWRAFQNSVTTTKPINKIGGKQKPLTLNQKRYQLEQLKKQLNKPNKEIKWELNDVDDSEVPTEYVQKEALLATPSQPTLPPLMSIGTASQIKFVQGIEKPILLSQKPTQKEETSGFTGNPSNSTGSRDRPLVQASGNPSASSLSTSDPDSHSTEIPKPKESSQLRQVPKSMQKEKTPAPPCGPAYSMVYPKGIPRSFLSQQNLYCAIQPQDRDPGLQINTNPEMPVVEPQQYSPSDVYEDGTQQTGEGSDSPDGRGGQKRLSAFHRLGPVSQPKKPKLTINLLCNKDQSVREVLEDDKVEKYTPVHLRKDIIESTDEIVVKYLPLWPWKRNVGSRKTVTARTSRSVMILEQEQMEEAYDKDNLFFRVSVRGYPKHWNKEHVLDAILDSVKGKSFIPCFTEFTENECKFLVIRSRAALVCIHKLGFYIRKDDIELAVTISSIDISLKQIDMIPRLVLRKQLATGYDGERKLSLKGFTTKPDISHFIYFPLNRVTNQTELVHLQSTVAWNFLTDLDLSHNRITSIDGLELPKTTPKLKNLDLSYNWLDKVTSLIHNRELALRTLKLEGNPLCHDYIDPGHYVRVVKMIFPALVEIDGVPIHLKGDLPKQKRNYCPSEAADVTNKFLEVFFPLLEMPCDERQNIEDMYDEKAVLTVTYRYSLRYSSQHRKFRNMFLRARVFDEGDAESIEGAPAITRLICKWPLLQHDPYTFTVDVIHHNDNSTILRIDGILKLTSESLAEDEQLLAFTRTVVLTSIDGVEYKILNEMVYWGEPSKELTNIAFQVNTIRCSKRLSLMLDSAPNEELKEQLTQIFMKITDFDKDSSRRCLELKNWNLKSALEYFTKLLKLDDLNSLTKELELANQIE